MTHPATALQTALVAALSTDAGLNSLLGEAAIYDSPPRDKKPPYLTITRHDVIAHDADLAPGWDHRLILQAWSEGPSRKAVAAIAERVVAVATGTALSGPDLIVTLLRHERTETAIDLKTGRTRAAIALRAFSEPAT